MPNDIELPWMPSMCVGGGSHLLKSDDVWVVQRPVVQELPLHVHVDLRGTGPRSYVTVAQGRQNGERAAEGWRLRWDGRGWACMGGLAAPVRRVL